MGFVIHPALCTSVSPETAVSLTSLVPKYTSTTADEYLNAYGYLLIIQNCRVIELIYYWRLLHITGDYWRLVDITGEYTAIQYTVAESLHITQ